MADDRTKDGPCPQCRSDVMVVSITLDDSSGSGCVRKVRCKECRWGASVPLELEIDA